MDAADTTFEVLDREECYALLATHQVGRLAVPVPGHGPLVVPVNFGIDREVIVFRSDLGTKLDALRDQAVSFEVDEIDLTHHTGWSVLIEGHAREVTHWEAAHVDVEPWAPGPKTHWIRLTPDSVSGRRIQLLPVESDPRGYL